LNRPGRELPTRFGCPEFRRQLALERRAFLKVGVLGFAGLSLADLLRAQAAALSPAAVSRERSVIILWMRGGPSQHETWDPKPEAPLEYRGEFGAIPTKVPGIQLCELLPLSAKIMDKWSIIRSLHHDDAGHSTGDQICFTGYPSAPNLPPEGPGNIMPSCGSIAARQLQQGNPRLPAYVMIPRMVPGSGAAYLGPAWNPFETVADPVGDKPFSVPNIRLPAGISLQRLSDRRSLVAGFDRLRSEVDGSGQMDALDRFQQQA
jgi:hypothetical protein